MMQLHLRGGDSRGGGGGGLGATGGSDDLRSTGIDPNIVKRIREKTVHLRQRMATTTAATAQTQHLDVLRHDWERRTRTYKEREERYTDEIASLEDAIVEFHAQKLRPEAAGEERDPMQPVGVYHRDIVNSLRELEGRSAAIKVERNRDLTRAHRARLLDWSKELENVRSKKEEGMRKWKQRADALEEERQWAANLCAKLTTLNADLGTQNAELRERFRVGEDDRKYLIHQLAQIKKDTARCHQASGALDDAIEDRSRAAARGKSPRRKPPGVAKGDAEAVAEHRKKRLEEIRRLEKGLEHQQRNLLQFRKRCARDAEESTSLQRLLRSRLVDLNGALDDAQIEAECGDEGDAPPSLALLTWQSRILTLLYETAFPANRAGKWLPNRVHR